MPRYEDFQFSNQPGSPDAEDVESQGFDKQDARLAQSENYTQSLDKEKGAERPILIDGSIRGIECDQMPLSDFRDAASFQECYFSTDSGNIYAVFKLPSGEIFLADARSNIGRGTDMKGSRISEDDLTYAVMEVGRSLQLSNSNTTTVKQIVVVTDAHFFTGETDAQQAREIAQKHTGGRISSIRRQFKEAVYSGL